MPRRQPAARAGHGLMGRGLLLPGDQQRFREVLQQVFPIRNEPGFELYFSAAITSWFTVTADVQAVDRAQREARSGILIGLRGNLNF